MKPKAFLLPRRISDTGRDRMDSAAAITRGQGCMSLGQTVNRGHLADQAASQRRSESLDLLDLWEARRFFWITSSTIIPQLTHRQP